MKQIFILLNCFELFIGLLSDIKPLNDCPLISSFSFEVHVFSYHSLAQAFCAQSNSFY